MQRPQRQLPKCSLSRWLRIRLKPQYHPKLPAIITYRINPITHAYVSRVVKVDYANLINVVLGREAVPELLQYECTPEKLAAAVTRLIDDKAAASEQIAAGQEALKVLGYGGVSPALRAADEVLAAIARKEQRG